MKIKFKKEANLLDALNSYGRYYLLNYSFTDKKRDIFQEWFDAIGFHFIEKIEEE